MRKRLISLLLVFCMVFSLLPTSALAVETTQQTTAEAGENPFKDVKESDWYYDAVQYARTNGFFSGTTATTFDPNGSMTRDMFVTVLGRMAGVDSTAYQGDSTFTDVPANMYCAPYVEWAAKYGITSGTGDGKFSPNARITRQQMAVFFVRYFEAFDVDYETDANITTTPDDMDSVSDYAKDAVLKLWKQGLLNGDGKSFHPNGSATRAQAATLCMRTDQAVDTWYKEPGVPSDRVSVDPNASQQPQKPEETKQPDSSGGSRGPGSSGGTNTTYYEVKFAMVAGQPGAGVTLPETKLYASGTKITTIPTPYQQDGVFLGWYYDADMTAPVNSNDTVRRNMTLYAKMGEVTPVSEVETPNYVSVTVPADQVATYSFGVSGYEPDCMTFINVTAGKEAVAYTMEETTVKVTWKQGQTYRIELSENSAAKLIVNGKEQPASIRVLNIITEKGEVDNLTLDGNVKCIPAASVSNMTGTALDGLFTVSVSTQDTGSVTQNKNAGTFTYAGSGIDVGDTVAIYSGINPKTRTARTSNDGAVAYVEITAINGSSYSYKTAEVEDVLFTPDILPVSTGADTDENPNNNSITVPESTMDFSADAYAEMGLDSQTTIDVGDYLAFYSGSLGSSAQKSSYARITGVTNSDGNYVITYEDATEDDILAAMDLYATRNEKIELTYEQKQEIEDSIEQQARESGFVEEAATYLTALALETDGFQELSDDLDMDLSSYTVTFADGTPVSEGAMELMAASASITKKNIKATVAAGKVLQHFEDSYGVRVELSMSFTVEVGDKIEIVMQAIFEEEVLISVNASGGAIWKWKWIFPYIYDYQLNANIDLGTYTGIGITATAKTKGDDSDDGFDWKPVTGHGTEGKIIDIGKQITELMEKKEEFLGEKLVDKNGEEIEWAGSVGGGLEEKYAAMMANAEESWVEIFRQNIFEQEGNVDPLHILCYGVKADFVVKANLYVTMGMTFEYGVAKRYNFSIQLFHNKSTNETIDLEESHYNFDFYVMGTAGIRAGLELEIAVGLFSLKLGSVGICAEVGAYAQMWGYFYYHLSWTESGGKESSGSGALAIEIGLYLTISFKAQLFSSDKLTYQPTLYDHAWPILTIGSIENVYDFAYEDNDSQLNMDIQSVTTVTVPSSLYDMKYMDMKTGDIYGDGDEDKPAKNYDSEQEGTNEAYFTIEFSNPKFSYQASDNSITVAPDGSVDETCEMTITWKGGALVFTSKPIQRTVTIHWSEPVNIRYISFDSRGGSSVPMISSPVGASITMPVPTKVGYDFGGWYTKRTYEDEFKFDFPAQMPDYRDMGITVYAKWVPRTDTKYTVEHYVQELNGTYTKTDLVDQMTGTTNTLTKPEDKLRDNGTTTATRPNVSNADETYELNFSNYVLFRYERPTIAPNGTAVAKIYYNRRTYPIEFTYGDIAEGNAPLSYIAKYGATVYAPKLVLDGYDFNGFEGLTLDGNGGVTVTGAETYAATWTARSDTPYRVEYYLRDTEDTSKWYYSHAQIATGTTGSQVSLDSHKSLENYTFVKATVNGEEITSDPSISADGKLVIKLYFDRNKATLTFEEMGGDTVNDITNQPYGTTVTLPKPVRTGYTFTGWYTDENCTMLFAAASALNVTMPAENKTLYAGWELGETVQYTVNHYQQNITDDNYTLYASQTLDGIKGKLPTDVANSYTGFTSQPFSNVEVTETGAVINIYYDRVTSTITFNTNGGTAIDSISGRYGAGVTAPADPTKTGYTFAGWDKTIPTTIPAENVTINANWTVNQYTRTVDTDDGSSVTSITQDYGTGVTAPANPTKAGYTCDGWSTKNGDNWGSKWDFASDMVTADLTLYAKLDANRYSITYEGMGDRPPKRISPMPIPMAQTYSGTIQNFHVAAALGGTTVDLNDTISNDTVYDVGGVTGWNDSGGIIKDCSVGTADAKLKLTITASEYCDVGGIAGQNAGAISDRITVTKVS